eukprot:19786-Eustigmatos_ZCMA.PRE.1
MDAHGDLTERLDVCREAEVRSVVEQPMRDAEERVIWPLVEPVDGAAVDERGKHAAAVAEAGTDRAHGKHHVQVLAHQLDVVLKYHF